MWLLVTTGERELPDSLLHPDIQIVVDESRQGVAKMANQAFLDNPEEAFYGFVCDDIRPQTEHWRERLVAASAGRYIAFGNDLHDDIPPDRVGSCYVLPGDMVRAAGWWLAPWCVQRGVDGVWTRLGRRLGLLRYCEDVIVEHLTWYDGRRPLDETDRVTRSRSHASPVGTRLAKLEEAALEERIRSWMERNEWLER